MDFDELLEHLDDLIDVARHEDFPNLATLLAVARVLAVKDRAHYSRCTPDDVKRAAAYLGDRIVGSPE